MGGSGTPSLPSSLGALLHEVALALVVAPDLVAALALELQVALVPAVALVEVVALVPAAVADPPGALGGDALAHAVIVQPPAAQELVVAPLPVVLFIGRYDVGVGVGVAWCCVKVFPGL